MEVTGIELTERDLKFREPGGEVDVGCEIHDLRFAISDLGCEMWDVRSRSRYSCLHHLE